MSTENFRPGRPARAIYPADNDQSDVSFYCRNCDFQCTVLDTSATGREGDPGQAVLRHAVAVLSSVLKHLIEHPLGGLDIAQDDALTIATTYMPVVDVRDIVVKMGIVMPVIGRIRSAAELIVTGYNHISLGYQSLGRFQLLKIDQDKIRTRDGAASAIILLDRA